MKNTNSLIDALNCLPRPLNLKSLQKTVENASGLEQELLPMSIISDEYYTRNVIHQADDYDLLIVTWQSKQRSPLHNHKGSACVVKVLQGQATEITFEKSPSGMLFPIGSNSIKQGEVVSSFDEDIHQMTNLGTKCLVTLHIYAPSLKNMQIFSLTDTCLERYDELVSKSYSTKTYHNELRVL